MARSNKKDVRRPEDWFPPVPYNTATIAGMDAAIAAAIAASFPIPESSVTGLVSDLAGKLNSSVAGTFGLTLLGEATLAAAKISLAYTKADVGLGSVDNTADSAKNVLSATKLTTARNINGVAFDGTGDITIAVGSGTVTTLSVVTANGVSGSVANPTTTPAITLTLGAITPTSVAASGNVTGANLSGTNTGDQTTVSGNAGSATKLATGRTLAITGDLTWTSPSFDGSGNVTAAGTLAASGVTAATYGDATNSAQITVDAKGRVTAATTVAISGLGGGSVSVVQYKSFIGGPPGPLTLAAAPTAGNQLLLIGTHWNGIAAVAAPWGTILNKAGVVDDGVFAVCKLVTPADTGSATVANPISQSSGGSGGSSWTLVEVSGALPIVSISFDSFQEITGTSSSVKVASGKNGSLVFGIASTTGANTAPSSITGATALTTVTGTTTSASPRQITPFQVTNVNGGTGVTITPNYAGSCKMYGVAYVFTPA